MYDFNNANIEKNSMKYIQPRKLRVIVIMFFVGAGVGIFLGLDNNYLYLTLLGIVNLCLGGLTGWILLTQKPRQRDRRKG
ncbi:uncharacterized protein METZ01_LOCUS217115 [marine metagenome]|uniref:Uncharacterized protein n=1 Tax=marine metagenome TaxID=408172 RepID=A0A382FQL9_9ZZZZ